MINSLKAMITWSRRNKAASTAVAVLILVILPQSAQAVRIVTWNLLNYNGGRESQFKTVLNAVQPDVLVVQEMGSQSAAEAFRDDILNAADGPGGYTLSMGHLNGSLNNACFYRVDLVALVGHTWLNTSPRDTDRWKFRIFGYTSANAEFYAYSMHLHSSDAASRNAQTNFVRNNANALPAGTNLLYAGDFNIDSSFEASYQNLVGSQADNDGRGFDPINVNGTWHNNNALAWTHTQSPHFDNPGAPSGAATGGMDDRFDFQLISAPLDDGLGLSYVNGTYETYGNDGLHCCNSDINDAPTIPEGTTIANALHGASDHLPVIADYQVPATITHAPELDFGTVIVGAEAEMDLEVSNADDAAVAIFEYIDDLEYTFFFGPGFSGDEGPFVEPAGGDGLLHPITMNTAAPGQVDSALLISISSQGVDEQQSFVSLLGNVLRHAVPSLDSASQVLTGEADFGTHEQGQFEDVPIDVHNVLYDAQQALLDVYDAQITGPDAAAFAIAGGFSPLTVAGTPQTVMLAFDDSGGPGEYSATLTLSTRDQQDLPGAIDLDELSITMVASIDGADTCNADLDGSEFVDVIDLLSLLSAWGECPGCPADIDGDGMVTVNDLLALLAAWGPCP